MAATGREVIAAVGDKLGTTDELLLVHLSSAAGKTTEVPTEVSVAFMSLVLIKATTFPPISLKEKQILKPNDVSVFSTLSINGRLFTCPRDQLNNVVSGRCPHCEAKMFF